MLTPSACFQGGGDRSGSSGHTGSAMPKDADRFGLLGLLSVIRMTDPDLNTLALGTDLTTLGLNLNSSECVPAIVTSSRAASC